MYLVVIAWLYVAFMMAFAEATNSNGTVLGAIVTFFLYGIGPLALVVYLMRTPTRRKKRRELEPLGESGDIRPPSRTSSTTIQQGNPKP
jgi:hypothetical protein